MACGRRGCRTAHASMLRLGQLRHQLRCRAEQQYAVPRKKP